MKYLKSFFVIVAVLYFAYTCTTKPSKEKWETFISVSAKEVPEFHFIKAFKQADEIPEFINSTPEDKEQWNSLAKRVGELTQILANQYKKFEAHSIVMNYRKTQDQYWEKAKLLSKGIEKIIEEDSRVQKIRDKMKTLNIEYKSATKKWGSFFRTKVKPLEKKQRGLIDKAYEKKYGSSEAGVYMTLKVTDAFEAKIKKTKKYRDLEEQLRPLKNQEKLLSKKREAFREKRMSLSESLGKIRNETKQSEDLPESLKKLMEEIRQLEIKQKRLGVEYKKFDLEEANKMRSETDELIILRDKLFKQFDKMMVKK